MVNSLVRTALVDNVGIVFKWLVEITANALTWYLQLLGGIISHSSSKNLFGRGFIIEFRAMGAVAATIALPILIISIIRAILLVDLSELLKSSLVKLPLALLLGAFALVLVQLLSTCVDSLSAQFPKVAGINLEAGIQELIAEIASISIGNSGSLIGVGLITVITGLVGAVLLVFELSMRQAVIELACIFLPVIAVFAVLKSAAALLKRTVEAIIIVISSKFVIVATLCLAFASLTSGSDPKNAVGLITPIALIWLAIFSPYALLKLIPSMDIPLIGAAERSRRDLSSTATEKMYQYNQLVTQAETVTETLKSDFNFDSFENYSASRNFPDFADSLNVGETDSYDGRNSNGEENNIFQNDHLPGSK